MEENWLGRVKESRYAGRIHPDTFDVNDFEKVKHFKSIPKMKKIELYHDNNLVFGFEVFYHPDSTDAKKDIYYVGHHIGSHLTTSV